ncbi:MAG: extracellular solute-binding protein [Actinomycetota bacterium]|nr:extracellular solute-binding protein [Actinomycetota bacterium]
MNSRKFFVGIVALILVIGVTAVFSFSGCTAQEAEQAVEEVEEAAEEVAEEVEETVEEVEETVEEVVEEEMPYEGTVITLMHDKGGNPNYQPYFEEMGSKTEEMFGIGIEPIPYPTTDVFISTVRAALPTEEPPDLFTWWSTYRMKELIDQGLLAETTDLWEKHKDEYSQGLIDGFTFDGKAYGFSYTQEYWPVWYNTEVFEELGLEEPETWDQFVEICDTMLENGVTPIAQTVQARWPTFIWFEEMIIGQDPDLYVDLCEGRAKYTDPEVKEAFGVWKSMIETGYFTDPAIDLFVDAPVMFNEGEVGMILCGTWYYESVFVANGVPEEKIDSFILPSHNPDAGKNVVLEMSPIVASANSQNLEATLQVADYLMSAEGNEIFASQNRSYPSNTESSTDFLPEVKVKIADTINNNDYRILNRYWEATPTPICEEAVDKFAEFITNPDRLNQILEELDTIADSYWQQ